VGSLDTAIFSFKTNKRILKSAVLISGIHQKSVSSFIDRNIIIAPVYKRENIKRLQAKSLDRMVDLLQNGADSAVLKKSPLGSHIHKKHFKNYLI